MWDPKNVFREPIQKKKVIKQKKQLINGILVHDDGLAVKDIQFKYYKYDWTSNASPETRIFVKNELNLTQHQCFML